MQKKRLLEGFPKHLYLVCLLDCQDGKYILQLTFAINDQAIRQSRRPHPTSNMKAFPGEEGQ